MLSTITRAAGVKEVIITIALQSQALTGLINSWLSKIYVTGRKNGWIECVLVDFLPGEKNTSFSKLTAHYVSSGQSALGQSSCLERSSLTLVVTFLLELNT